MEDNVLELERTKLHEDLHLNSYRTLTYLIVPLLTPPFWKKGLKPRNPTFFLATALIIVLIVVLGFVLEYFIGGTPPIVIRIVFILSGSTIFLSLTLTEIYLGYILRFIDEHLIDAIYSTKDILNLQHTLNQTFSPKLQIYGALTFAFITHVAFPTFDFLTPSSSISLVKSVGYGIFTANILLNILYGNTFYLVIYYFILLLKIRTYNVKLFALNPARSVLIRELSSLITKGIYILVIFSIIFTVSWTILDNLLNLPPIILIFPMMWGPNLGLFILGHYIIFSLIRRNKRHMISVFQMRIETNLDIPASSLDQATFNRLEKWIHLHDLVDKSHNTAIDFWVLLNLVVSLITPFFIAILLNFRYIYAIINDLQKTILK